MVFRMRIESTRLFGVALSGFAVGAAWSMLDANTSDGPVADAPSAAIAHEVMSPPRPVAPIGTVDPDRACFAWTWDDRTPPSRVRVVLLDECFVEIDRSESVDDTALSAERSRRLLERLRPGARYHWIVQVENDPMRRSGPMPLRLAGGKRPVNR